MIYKNTCFLIMLLLVGEFYALNNSETLTPPKEGCLMVFTKKNYKGQSKEICGDMAKIGKDFIKSIKSVRLGKGVFMTAFKKYKFSGKNISVNRNVRNLRKEKMSRVKSLLITNPNCLTFYSKCKFKGKKFEVCKDTAQLPANLDNKASSVVAGKNTWKLFKDGDFKGESFNSIQYSYDKCLKKSKLGNKAMSSAKIFEIPLPANCVRLFQGENYTGTYTDYCETEKWVGSQNNDKFSSIKIGKSAFAMLFKHKKLKGKHYLVTENIPALKEKKFDDMLSSLVVFQRHCSVLFTKCNFQGSYSIVCGAMEQFPKKFDNKYQSYINGDKEYDLFADKEFKGKKLVLKSKSYDECIRKVKFAKKASSTAIHTGELDDECIRFYTDANDEKSYRDYCGDVPKLFKKYKNKFSRIVLGKSVCAVIFDKPKFKGDRLIVEKDIKNLKEKKFDNKIESILIYKRNCVNLYKHCDFYGGKVEICESTPFLEKLNNQVSSYVVGSSDWIMHDKKKYKGKQHTIKAYTADNCLVDNGFNDLVTSLSKAKAGTTASNKATKGRKGKGIKKGCVRLYQHINFKGASKLFCKDFAKFAKNGKENDQYSSARLGRGVSAVIFQHYDYKGKSLYIHKNIKDFRKRKFNDIASSIILVGRGCIKLFQHYGFGGKATQFCKKSKFVGKKINDQFSSYIVGNHRWVLFEHGNFKGAKLVAKRRSVVRKIAKGWNDKVSSLRRHGKGKGIKKGCVRLYQHINFKGASKLFCKDFAKFAKNGKENDQYSSARLGRGVSAVIFQHYDYKGKSLYIHKNIKDFRKRKFNDIASSIILVGRGCIKLFQHYGFGGKATQFCKKSKFVGKKINDQFSSYIVGNHRWVLFEHGNFKGAKLVAKRRSVVRKIAKGWNDKVSSLRRHGKGKGIKKGCVRLYQHINFKGASKLFCKDFAKFAKNGKENDQYSSARLGRGVSAVIFQHYDYKGKSLYIHKNIKDFRKRKFNDIASSIILVGRGCIKLFQHYGFGGKATQFCKKSKFVGKKINDQFSSYIVGNHRWVLFEHGNFKGAKLVAKRRSVVRKIAKGWNDKVSSLRRHGKGKGIKKGCVRLYQHINFKGASKLFCKDFAKFAKNGKENDQYSSARLGRGVSAVIFQHYDYKGKSLYIHKNIKDFRKRKFNDIASSIILVGRGCIKLFQHYGFGGKATQFCKKSKFVGKKINDQFSSYIVGNHRWVLFEHGNFKGAKLVAKRRSVVRKIAKGWNDKVSSLRRHGKGKGIKKGCVRLYQHINFKGASKLFCKDFAKFAKNGKENDQYSSARLGRGVSAVIFQHYDYKGKSLYIHKNIKDFRKRKFNDIASSIILVGRGCIKLFQHYGFGGKATQFCKKSKFVGKKINDQFSSYIVGNHRWVLFEHGNFKGAKLVAKRRSVVRKIAKGWNDKVSSLRRHGKGKGIKKGCVRLYQHINFKGASKLFCKDFAKFAKNGKENDQYSSARLGRGVSAVIFQHYDYKGKSLYIHKNIKDFRKRKFNDIASSIILVGRGCIKLFQHYGFGGKATQFCKKSKFVGKKINDQFSSYIVGNHRWVLFEHGNFKGAKLVAKRRSVVRKIAKGWNDKVSSLRRHGKGKGIKKGCVRLYQHINFKGASKLFCKDFAKFAKNGKENDQYSSARLGRGVSAVIFQHYDYKGKSLYIHKNIKDFRKRKFNDIASSIILVGRGCIKLFQHYGFGGKATQFCKKSKFVGKKINDQFSSYIVGNHRWVLFEHGNFKGAKLVAKRRSVVRKIAKGWNDKVSSLRRHGKGKGIKKGCVRLYQHINFKGASKLFCKDFAKFAKNGKENDQYSSARLGRGVSAVIFQHYDYKGKSLYIHKNIKDFRKRKFNDIASSIILVGRGCIKLFQHYGFGGKATQFCKKSKFVGKKINDQFSSYIVGNHRWVLFEHGNFKGAKLVAKRRSVVRKIAKGWNDKVSSLRRHGKGKGIKKGCVRLYQHINFKGASKLFCKDFAKFAKNGKENDQYSSARLGRGVSAVIFQHYDYKGKSLYIHKNIKDFRKRKFNDIASSIILVGRGCIKLFQHYGFGGKATQFCKKSKFVGKKINDQFSSYIVGNHRWVLFEHGNFKGAKLVAKRRSVVRKIAKGWNDKVSSLRRHGKGKGIKKGCVRLYQHINFKGASKLFCKDFAKFAKNGKENDQYSSARLGRGVSAVIFQHYDYKGKSLYIHKNIKDFRKRKFNDIASSIILVGRGCIKLFQHYGFGGKATQFCKKSKFVGKKINDQFSSYIVGNHRWVLFEHGNFKGAKLVAKRRSVVRKIAKGWNDKVSSLRRHGKGKGIKKGCVRLYQHINFKGASKLFCKDFAKFAKNGKENDQYSSARLGRGVSAVIFQHYDYKGKSLYIHKNIKDFRKRKFNDIASSIILVGRGCIKLFQHYGFGGKATQFCKKSKFVGKKINDQFSSYIVGNHRWVLFEHGNFKGAKLVAKRRSVVRKIAKGWNDKVSSLRRHGKGKGIKKGCVRLYQHINFKGASKLFCKDFAKFAKNGKENDQYSSARLGRGVSAVIFQHYDYKGKSLYIHKNIKDFRKRKFNDIASSIILVGRGCIKLFQHYGFGGKATQFCKKSKFVGKKINDQFSSYIVGNHRWVLFEHGNFKGAKLVAKRRSVVRKIAKGWNDKVSSLRRHGKGKGIKKGCVRLYQHINFKGASKLFCKDFAKFAKNGKENDQYSSARLGRGVSAVIFQHYDYKGKSLYIHKNIKDFRKRKFNDIASSIILVGRGCIKLFQHYGFGGKATQFCKKSKFVGKKINDQFSSYIVGNHRWVLFEHGNFKGAKLVAKRRSVVRKIAKGWNDKVSSLRRHGKGKGIKKGCVRLYQHINFKGASKLFCKDFAKFAKNGKENDQYSSARLGRGVSAVIFQHYDYKGKSLYIHKNIKDFRKRKFNDIASSIILVGRGCIKLFQHYGFGGKATQFCKKSKFVGKKINDQFSSYIVGNHRWVLFEHGNFKGAKLVAKRRSVVRKIAKGWNDKVSSLRRHGKGKGIKKGCVRLYQHINFKGASKLFCKDFAKFAKNGKENDQYSSARLGRGVSAVIFQHYDYKGKSLYIHKNIKDFRKRKFNDIASSIILVGRGCIKLFQHYGFGGKATQFCKKSKFVGKKINDQFSSYIVGNHRWVLFEHGNFKGAKLVAKRRSVVRKIAKGWNDKVSSLRRHGKGKGIKKGCVRLYQHINFKGASKLFCKDFAKFAKNGKENDQYSSARLGRGVSAVIFQHYDYKGKSLYIHKNIKDFRKRKFNDIASSIILVGRGCIKLFQHYGFGGKATQFCKKSKFVGKKINDQFSSYIVGNHRWVLFEHGNFKGAKLVAKRRSVVRKIAKGWNDKVSSLRRHGKGKGIKKGCVRLYQHINFKGASKLFCKDFAKFAKNGKENDQYSSARLGRGVSAVIFQHYDYKGKSLYIHKNIKDFRKRKFNDIASSIILVGRGCIKLFQHYGFGGKATQFCKKSKFVGKKINDQFSSYIVGNHRWVLFEHGNFKGAKLVAKRRSVVRKIAKGWNDKVSSLRRHGKGKGIKKGCVRLYQHINFKGASKLFCKDFAKFAKNGKENDQYSSARLGRGVSAVIFQHYDYKGKSLYIHKNIKDFRKRKFNDIASSIILVGRGCIKLFQHYGFGGKATQFCKKSKFVGKKINDQFSSYIVGNHRWVLFEHGNFKGAKLVAKRRSVVRKIAKGWNDKVSSLRRHGKGKGIKKGCVRLYQHINFKGASKLFCKDFAKFAKNGKENDQYSSARLGRGVSAVIFQHYDYKGKSLYIHKNIKDFRKRKFNDIASSIRILNKKCLYLFSKSDFNESARQFCKSNSSLQKDGLLKFGSFIRGSRKWIVYDQTFFKGFSANISGKKSIANIAPDFFTGYVASVKIYESGLKSHCIRLYEKIDFGGNFKDYCKRKNKVSKKYDNKFSSAKIGSKVYAVLFDDSKYKGSNLKVHGDISDFSKYSFKDTVSSLIIHKRECLLLFKGCGFKGKSRHLCRNFKKLPRKQNNSYSSYINGEISFDVFAKPGFTGRKMTIDPTKIDSCLKDDEFNNVISSFKLTSNKPNDNCAIFFRNKDYTGWNIEYCDDKKIISRIQNNNFSSVRVGKNVEVLLFEGKSFAKKSLRVKESTHDLSVYKWNNKTSSIIIAKKGCISLYQHKNFKGKKSEICKDTPALGAADDSFSSYVNTDFAWNLYVHKNYEGRSIHVAAHEEAKSLTALRFNEITSSIKRGQPELSLGCVRLFKDENYNGDYKDVCKHDKDLLSNDLNGVKSVQLSENAFAVLFSETKFMGKIEYILESSQNIEKIDAKSIIVIKSNCMTYFNNCDFGGRREEICGQDKNLTSSQTGMASYLNGKVDFEIFGENDFFGRPKVIEQITWKRCTINQGIPDLMSSIKPHEDSNNLADGCIRLYEHEDHKGKHKTYCDDHPYVFDDYNNIFSSIEIGKNVYVMLFEEKNYLGKELYVFDSHKSFKSFKFDDLTTSLIIVKRNCITFFTDCDFKKDKTTVCGNVADFGNLDEKISSYINGDTPYWLYQNKNYDGNKISADVRGYEKCMSIFAWDDEVSSVAIK